MFELNRLRLSTKWVLDRRVTYYMKENGILLFYLHQGL